MSIQPTKLILAFLALAAICITGRVMDFNETVGVVPSDRPELDAYISIVFPRNEYPDALPNDMTELDAYVTGVLPADLYAATFAETEKKIGVFSTLWNFGARHFHLALTSLAQGNVLGIAKNVAACFNALLWAFRYHTIYSLIFFTVALAMMSLCGGAICRVAALQFAQGEKPGLTEAFQFGRKKFYSFLTAPIVPFAIAAGIGLTIFLLGLVGNYISLMVGLFLPLAFLSAALIALLTIGVLAGFNLMFPAIAYEDSDCFDAISRSFSCVYAKPWHMGFYTATATIYGALCYVFVRFFAFLLLWITRQFLELGFVTHDETLANIWPRPNFTDFLGGHAATPTNWSTSASAFLIYVWVLVVVGLMVSFVISFYFSANTIIYALMRNRVDKTALDEIYTGTDELAAELAPVPVANDKPAGAEPASETDEAS